LQVPFQFQLPAGTQSQTSRLLCLTIFGAPLLCRRRKAAACPLVWPLASLAARPSFSGLLPLLLLLLLLFLLAGHSPDQDLVWQPESSRNGNLSPIFPSLILSSKEEFPNFHFCSLFAFRLFLLAQFAHFAGVRLHFSKEIFENLQQWQSISDQLGKSGPKKEVQFHDDRK